jgi:hypothetical protein
MGRMLLLLAIVPALMAIGYGISVGIKASRKRRERRDQERKLRDLARFAPAVLHGSPLVDVVVDQGRQLDHAAGVLRALTAGSIEVYIADDTLRQRISAWLTEYEKGKTQS